MRPNPIGLIHQLPFLTSQQSWSNAILSYKGSNSTGIDVHRLPNMAAVAGRQNSYRKTGLTKDRKQDQDR